MSWLGNVERCSVCSEMMEGAICPDCLKNLRASEEILRDQLEEVQMELLQVKQERDKLGKFVDIIIGVLSLYEGKEIPIPEMSEKTEASILALLEKHFKEVEITFPETHIEP